MILYHGSTVPVEKPEIRISESFLDFGTGFYTTTSLQQAERWARIKTRRENKPVGYVLILMRPNPGPSFTAIRTPIWNGCSLLSKTAEAK